MELERRERWTSFGALSSLPHSSSRYTNFNGDFSPRRLWKEEERTRKWTPGHDPKKRGCNSNYAVD